MHHFTKSIKALVIDLQRYIHGHGEHYGYPRHHCYVLLWWNRRGYAFGCEWVKEGKP